jgi:hypothetical protein
MRDEEFGRGQNPSWAGTTPLLPMTAWPKKPWGRSSPAPKIKVEFARAQKPEHAVCNAGCNASINDERREIAWHF